MVVEVLKVLLYSGQHDTENTLVFVARFECLFLSLAFCVLLFGGSTAGVPRVGGVVLLLTCKLVAPARANRSLRTSIFYLSVCSTVAPN